MKRYRLYMIKKDGEVAEVQSPDSYQEVYVVATSEFEAMELAEYYLSERLAAMHTEWNGQKMIAVVR